MVKSQKSKSESNIKTALCDSRQHFGLRFLTTLRTARLFGFVRFISNSISAFSPKTSEMENFFTLQNVSCEQFRIHDSVKSSSRQIYSAAMLQFATEGVAPAIQDLCRKNGFRKRPTCRFYQVTSQFQRAGLGKETGATLQCFCVSLPRSVPKIREMTPMICRLHWTKLLFATKEYFDYIGPSRKRIQSERMRQKQNQRSRVQPPERLTCTDIGYIASPSSRLLCVQLDSLDWADILVLSSFVHRHLVFTRGQLVLQGKLYVQVSVAQSRILSLLTLLVQRDATEMMALPATPLPCGARQEAVCQLSMKLPKAGFSLHCSGHLCRIRRIFC